MVALGFSKDTKMAILLKSIGTERLKDSYAARGASLYAFAKMSIDSNVSSTKTEDNKSDHGVAGDVVSGDLPTGGTAPTGAKTGVAFALIAVAAAEYSAMLSPLTLKAIKNPAI